MTQDDLVYQKALKLSELTEAPGIGLSTTVANITTPIGFKTLIRQNNTIIELCVQLSQQVQALEARIRALEAQKTKVEALPDSLITKLENLSLGPKERPKEPRGLLRVHRNPNKLLQDELDKLKLKPI